MLLLALGGWVGLRVVDGIAEYELNYFLIGIHLKVIPKVWEYCRWVWKAVVFSDYVINMVWKGWGCSWD